MEQPKYFDKFSVVEAFQITEETRMNNSNWPEWLWRAWNGNRDDCPLEDSPVSYPRNESSDGITES